MLRIRQIVGTGMLEKYSMGKQEEDRLVQFIYDNKQVERDIAEDGSQDSGSLEDGSGQVPAPGGTDLHEAGSLTCGGSYSTSKTSGRMPRRGSMQFY